MHELLSKLESPLDLHKMNVRQLDQVGEEIRDVLCNLLSERSAHFASNLGVIELCLALHSTFDFSQDRLIWDTGHQIYPHKLITGRYDEFSSIRTKGGLMGYPNPEESPYDLFMTGHAGSSVSTMHGCRVGDELLDQDDRHAVAVIGDGAFPSGIVYEALNNISGLKTKMLVVLNDNKMSICPRVGGLGSYLDRLRTNSIYTGFKSGIVEILNKVPLLGDPAERFLAQLKEAVKAGLHGGMMFEDLGFRYLGPIDGHNIPVMKKYLKMVKKLDGPILLHVVTEKGHGYKPAESDPSFFHTPPVFKDENGQAIPKSNAKSKPAYTHCARDAIGELMRSNERVTVMTAAMCQGNKLEPVREEFPDRFFDTGICESHTVAFAAGQAKVGLRPIVAIYSTFLQRAFDQIFQEVALQNLPVTFMLDRSGLCGPDGATHHGVFDFGYQRLFPNMVVMAPGDANDVGAMLEFALEYDGPCSIRYPKATAENVEREFTKVELARAETLSWGNDGMILCCGTQLADCKKAAETLREEGLNVGVVNARFLKPLDEETILGALRDAPFVVTVEEAALVGGFGSAVLELASEKGVDTRNLHRLGIPDQFVEHGDRPDLLADLKLDAAGIAQTCREMSQVVGRIANPSETV